MAEKLASRTPERADTVTPDANRDAFDDIIAREYSAHDEAVLDDIIADHGRGLNSSDLPGRNELFDESAFAADAPDSSFFGRENSATPPASAARPTALVAPAPTPTLPTTPAPTLPLTPVPAPTPETPPSRVRINTDPAPEHPPTDTPPPEAPPALPPTDEHDRGRPSAASELKLVMVDQSKDVDSFARDAAEARLTQELNEGGKVKRFFKGIWKGNIAKNYYRNQYASEARADIIAHQDLLVRAESSKDKRDAAMQATIERFGHELGERLINRNADDTLEQYTAHEKDSAFSSTMKNFVRDCIVQGLDDATITEQYKRVAHEYRINHPDDKTVGEGLVQLSNITEIIKATKGAVEHGESLDNVVAGMKIITGEARTGVRSEARQTATDKAVEWMSKHKWSAWVPEGIIAGASSVVSFVVRAGSSKTIGLLTSPFTLGLSLVAPAVVGGIREKVHVKAERTQHSREMAMGGNEIDSTAPQTRRQKILRKIFGNRREQMEKTRLNTLSADEVTTNLRSRHEDLLLDDADREPGKTKDSALQAAIDALAEIEVYNLTSDNEKKDLISYDGVASIPEQRFQLALARAELKAALESELDDATRARLGFTSEGTIDAILERQATGAIEAIATDVDKKQAAFKKMSRFRVAKMAGIAVVAGAVLGGIAQETVSTFTDTNGVIEQAWGGGDDLHNGVDHQTIAERLINGAEQDPGHHGPSSEFTSPVAVGERGQLSVSADHTIVKNEDGTINLVDPNGKSTIDHLEVNPDGSLPQSSIDTLHEHGMDVQNTSTTKEVLDAEPRQVGLDEYMQTHQADTTPVTRDYWYDNDTSRFDENELRLHWTGSGAVTEGDKTSYHLNISAMTEGGSTHGAQSAHWAELAQQGKMKVAISPDGRFQTAPMMVDINPDGTINITPDDPAAKFFTVRDGEAVFTGRYLEVVETREVDAEGKLHICPLSTLVGTGEAGAGTYEVPSYHQEVQPAYKITTDGYDTPGSFVEVPPSIPIVSRKSLENLRQNPVERPVPSPMYYGSAHGLEKIRRWVNSEPGRLRTRRLVKEADGSERWLEADGSPVERSVDRERSEITRYLEHQRATNLEHYNKVEQVAAQLGEMSNSARVAVCVPAWMEETTISHFLDEYTKQTAKDGTPMDMSLFEVNVLVNRKTGTPSDGTVAAIEKFISDFEAAHGVRPNINFVDVEVDPPNNNVGYARKLLTDAVLMRSVARSGQTGPLYIETEDADIHRLDPRTVANLIDKMDKNPHLDAVRGTADRNPELLKENDKLFLTRRIWDFTENFVRTKDLRDPSNPEWNYMWNRVWMNGWNAGYSAEAYALIDGYDAVPVGEDMRIGEKIAMVRGDGNLPNLEVVAKIGTRSDGSPRRFIAEVELGVAAYAPGQFENPKVNQLIRENTDEQLLKRIERVARITPENEKEFNGLVKDYAKFIRKLTPSQAEAERITKRVLFWLGFEKSDYTLTGTDLQVHSWDNVRHALDRYRAKHAGGTT